MTSIKADENRRLAQTIEQRAGTGHSEIVAGWQSMLQDMLTRMQPFLKPGSIVTFQQLLPDEKVFFDRLVDEVPVPTVAQAFYLPPSVRHQMMGGQAGDSDDIGLSDAGVLVASRVDNHDVIVNALFALRLLHAGGGCLRTGTTGGGVSISQHRCLPVRTRHRFEAASAAVEHESPTYMWRMENEYNVVCRGRRFVGYRTGDYAPPGSQRLPGRGDFPVGGQSGRAARGDPPAGGCHPG